MLPQGCWKCGWQVPGLRSHGCQLGAPPPSSCPRSAHVASGLSSCPPLLPPSPHHCPVGRPIASLPSGPLSDPKPALAPLSLKDTSRFQAWRLRLLTSPQCLVPPPPQLPTTASCPPPHSLREPSDSTPFSMASTNWTQDSHPHPPSSPTRCIHKQHTRNRSTRSTEGLRPWAVSTAEGGLGHTWWEFSPRSSWPAFTALSPRLQPQAKFSPSHPILTPTPQLRRPLPVACHLTQLPCLVPTGPRRRVLSPCVFRFFVCRRQHPAPRLSVPRWHSISRCGWID